MRNIKCLIWLAIILPASASAWQWQDLWHTRDQQGSALLHANKAESAAHVFKDPNWQSVALYRAGDYAHAFTQFNAIKTSDGQYNAGNAAALMGKYQEAISAYDKAIALNSNNVDAQTNREIVRKLQQQQQKDSSGNNNKRDKNKPADNPKNNEQKNPADKDQQPPGDQQKPAADNANQANKKQQKSGTQEQNANAQSAAVSKQQRQDENNKQILRRLDDDSGGLLQKKFLRDYARRHGVDENSN